VVIIIKIAGEILAVCQYDLEGSRNITAVQLKTTKWFALWRTMIANKRQLEPLRKVDFQLHLIWLVIVKNEFVN